MKEIVKAQYGKNLITQLAKDLSKLFGKGFSRSNLVYMRLFYVKYPKGVTPSHLLTWSHYYELLKIKNDTERKFYENQICIETWSIRELRRQKKSGLFQRLALSKNKEEILELAKEKDDIFIEYATVSVSNKLAVTDYQLYLPDKMELKEKLKEMLQE